MAASKQSREVTQALDALYASAMQLMESRPKPPQIFGELFRQLDAVTQARRARLQLSTGIVPGLLWMALYRAQC
jgi:hypothetical protein